MRGIAPHLSYSPFLSPLPSLFLSLFISLCLSLTLSLTHTLFLSLTLNHSLLLLRTHQMVNLSPTEESYFESLCSLRFASQVNQCELGKPKKNLKDGHSASDVSVNTSEKSTPSSSVPGSANTSSKIQTSGLRRPKPIAN